MHLKWGLRSSWGYGLELLETLLVLIQVFTGKSCGLVQGSEEPDRFCKGENLSDAWMARSLKTFNLVVKTFHSFLSSLISGCSLAKALLLLLSVHSDIHADFSHSAPLSGSSLPM